MVFDLTYQTPSGVSLEANYALTNADIQTINPQDAPGGVWIPETSAFNSIIVPYEQRHRLNLFASYRVPSRGASLLDRIVRQVEVSALLVYGSGRPYLPVTEPNLISDDRASVFTGETARMPGVTRLDLHVGRDFSLGARAKVSAFVWVQNVLNADNVFDVWAATGEANDDGFLATRAGEQYLQSNVPTTAALYQHRTRVLDHYGIPRLTRLGLRLRF